MVGKNADGKESIVRVGDDGSLGSAQGTYMASTSSISSGPYSWIYAHVDSSVTIISTDLDGDALSGMTIKGGSWYRCGNATAVTRSSGEITVYKA